MADRSARQTQYIELLNGSQSRLFGYLYAHVLNMADAEDLYQQVAMLLWEKFDQFIPGTDFGAWAIRVAELKIKSFVRTKRRSKLLFSDAVMDRIVDYQSQLSQESVEARTDALQKCLTRLPKMDRELIEQCYAGDYKIKDVAENEGRSAGAMYTALSRIRQVLLACIERTVAAEAR